MRRLFAALLLSASPLLASAASITVHNTGVGVDDQLVAPGAATAFWTLAAKPGGSAIPLSSVPFRFKHPAYAADTTTSAWVSPDAAGNAGATGQYVYDLVVDLTGLNVSTVSISGLFSSDNEGAVWVNDAAPALTVGFSGFTTMHSFTLDSGFVAGANVIHAMVNNGGDPTGFHVEFTSATGDLAPVPLPPAATLMMGGLGVLVTRRRQAA